MIKGIKKIVKKLLRASPSTVIIMYHRVADIPDLYGVSVSPENFKEYINVLKNFQTCNLSEIFSNPTKKKVAITFDDGYIDIIPALEEMKKHGLRATIFIPTGLLGKKFWWDELSEIFFSDFQKLELEIDNEKYKFEVYGKLPDKFVIQLKKVDLFPGRHKIRKDELFTWLYFKLKYMRLQKIKEVMEQMKEQVKNINEFPQNRVMEEKDIKYLKRLGFEIGAHSVNHEVLSILKEDEQESEIRESKKQLESILGEKINTFAYPFGLKEDFSVLTIRKVKEAGFEYACTGIKGVILPHKIIFKMDRFKLKRFIVMNWSKETFERKIQEFFTSI